MFLIDEGKGQPIVFLHGFPLTHAMWRDQIRFFKANYRTLAVDLPGFGKSPLGAEKTLKDYADSLEHLLLERGIREPIVLVGFSMGGYISFPFYFSNPKRVRALVLCDTRSIADTPVVARGREALAKNVLAKGPLAAYEAMLPKLFAKTTSQRNLDLLNSVKQMVLSCSSEGVATALKALAAREDYTSRLKDIHCPTLVLVGEEDAISTPTEMKEIADALPDSQFRSLSNAGHMSPMENPKEFNEALGDFLSAQG